MNRKLVREKMVSFLRHKLPGWSRSEIRRVATACIRAGEKAERAWTPKTDMPKAAFVARAMEPEIARALFLPREGSDAQESVFIIATNPQSRRLANPASGEDEDQHIETLDFDLRDERVHRALARMTRSERDILLRHYFQGATMTEIGSDIGFSKSWTWRQMEKAQKRFRSLYMDDAKHRPTNTIKNAKEEFQKAIASLKRVLEHLDE